jgi:hypothetical protein
MQLEKRGYRVAVMQLYAICLERSFMTARNNTPREMNIIIDRLTDDSIEEWIRTHQAEWVRILSEDAHPGLCSDEETWVKPGESYTSPWKRRRCAKYCNVREICQRSEQALSVER